MLQPEATLMSIGQADTRGHTDVCGPHKVMLMSMLWDVSEGLAWAMILLQPKAVFMVCAVTKNHTEAHGPCSC